MAKEKILIEITDSCDSPKVIVNGEEVKITSIDYSYKTETSHDSGKHILNLVMPDTDNGLNQSEGIAFERF